MNQKSSKIITAAEFDHKYRITDFLSAFPEYEKESIEKINLYIKQHTSLEKDVEKTFKENILDSGEEWIEIRIMSKNADFVDYWRRDIVETDVMIQILVQKWVKDLADDLCFFMYSLEMDADERVRYSGMKRARRKAQLGQYLQKLKMLSEDPVFLRAIGVDSEIISDKLIEYSLELRQLNPKRKRGGQKKILDFPLFPIFGKLDLIDYTEHKKAHLLVGLIQFFNLPEYRAQTKKQLVDNVTKWFKLRMD